MRTKIQTELCLEEAEMRRFEQGLRDDGFIFDRMNRTARWGILRNKLLDPNFGYFKISKTGDLDKFRISAGFALDKDGLIINYKYPGEDITIPQMGVGYWVKISHRYEAREKGVVSIGGANKALMNGVGTEFTKVLRGQPNFPSKIRFLNSTRYNLEYEVLGVTDDNNVLIQGIFDVPETGLQYAVVGTFSPGHQPAPANKQIFQYDSCLVSLIPDFGMRPTLVDGKEFIIGHVFYSPSGMTFTDYRYECTYRSIDLEHVDTISTLLNPLAAIQSVKSFASAKRRIYIVELDWKFNITSEIQNNGVNTVAITSGYGGKFLDTTLFQNGDFDGWRYYYADGNYSTVLSSVKQGNTILLNVDGVRIGSGQGICVTPNAEEIEVELQFLDGGINPLNIMYKKSKFMSIACPDPTIIITQDEVMHDNQVIRPVFGLKTHVLRTYRSFLHISDYLNQAAYDASGTLINASSRTTSSDIILSNSIDTINNNVPSRVLIPWFPKTPAEIMTKFDPTGLGLVNNEFSGWAIANGLNDTPNALGRFIVFVISSTQIPNATPFAPAVNPAVFGNPDYILYAQGGEANVGLTWAQMPSHNHAATDSGHTHTIHVKAESSNDSGSGAIADGNADGQPTVVSSQTAVAAANITVHPSGSNEKHNNLPPYLAGIPVIKLS